MWRRGTKIARWGGSDQPFRPAIFRGFRAVLCLRNVPTVTGIIVRALSFLHIRSGIKFCI